MNNSTPWQRWLAAQTEPKTQATKASRRCTVCASKVHDAREHTAEERQASRDIQTAKKMGK